MFMFDLSYNSKVKHLSFMFVLHNYSLWNVWSQGYFGRLSNEGATQISNLNITVKAYTTVWYKKWKCYKLKQQNFKYKLGL